MTNIARRVLHLIDTGGPGGAETVFLDLVRELPKRGWTSVPVVPERDWLDRQLVDLGLEAAQLDTSRAFDLSYARAIRRLVRRERIDLVQTHLLGTSVYATLACIGTAVPVVSTFHGRPDIQDSDPLRFMKARLLSRRKNRVVCVSESLRRHFVRSGYLPESTHVIPNGADLVRSPGPRADLRSELGLSPRTRLVGAVGNVRASKAYDRLIRAFARIVASVPSAELVIAGQCQGRLADELLALRDRLGLTDVVHFLGFREDVADILASLDVFVLSSSDEGFSLVTVQAMASGLPVVVTRSGGPEDIVGDSGSAVLVPPDDEAALSEAVVELLSDAEAAGALGEAARRHVENRFSVAAMVDGYAELYASLLGSSSATTLGSSSAIMGGSSGATPGDGDG